MLNSMWGKFGQRENQGHTEVVKEPHRLFELLSSPDIEVHQVVPVNDNMIYVHWQYHDEVSMCLPTVNAFVAAYTTTHARLELYSYLERLGDRVLYFDTDSVIYIERPNEYKVPTGYYLGEMTNELECYGPNAYIRCFVSGGPKNYAFEVYDPDTYTSFHVCKVRGFPLNYDASKINFHTIRDMIDKRAKK